ncbi:hypothetical protein EPUL_006177 [Erysiphe pulchra]|uniref:Ubiquitin carboxyl-terminal hydrolase 7 ICP0-binding domain-containing protein n=1 Tax=Erysiphe pulchra TaxID=225359 RepID=A0A2S4PJM4_9PEZI|nr:hypothetical protein EPUL_006177 [Erysiphe pulchra]
MAVTQRHLIQFPNVDFTIRLKHTFYTVFLLVKPETIIHDINGLLLNALRDRYPAGLPLDPKDSYPNAPTLPLPQDSDEIILGAPKDQHDLSCGFDELDASIEMKDSQSLKSLGLKDGSILVFAFMSKGKDIEGDLFKVELPDLDVLYGENA